MSKLRLKLSEQLTEATSVPVNVTAEDVQLAKELSQGSEVAGENYVMPYAKNLAKSIGLKVNAACKEAQPKRLYRIFYKAVTQYDKDITQVSDIGRMRLLVENAEQIEALRDKLLHQNRRYKDTRIGRLLDAHPTNEIKIKEVEDYYHYPSSTGRIGMHITLEVVIPGKKVVPYEIQVLHKDMVETEDFTRSNYMNAQAIRRTALAEGRSLTAPEKKAIESYDASSRERYTADALKLGLFDLRRSDIGGMKRKREAAAHLRLAAA